MSGHSADNLPAKKGSSRGKWLVIAIFVIGGLALAGMFLAPRGRTQSVDRPIRFLSYNTFKCARGVERIIGDIQKVNPDFVFLQEVQADQWEPLAQRLGMNVQFRRHDFLPQEGIAIFSRFPLENVEAIVDANRRTCALFADTKVDNFAFTVVAVHLQATQDFRPDKIIATDHMRGQELDLINGKWQERGSKPVVIGGDFNQVPMGRNYAIMRRNFVDALSTLGKTAPTLGEGKIMLRADYLLVSKDWRILSGGVPWSDASDHRPIWVELKPPAGRVNSP